MAYISLITYGIYDLNSSLFLELIREILEVEFNKQRNQFAKTFLPKIVKKDEYLLSPVSDTDINPAFCSVIKAASKNAENHFHQQSNEDNTFIIGVLADGLENLRKILDSIYIILNDMDVKNYLFTYGILSDTGKYRINQMNHEFEVSKTSNDKNIVYGSLTLQAEIAEIAKENLRKTLKEVGVELEFNGQSTNLES